MTPAEHLAEAERLLGSVQDPGWSDMAVPRTVAATVALAHAVIAAAAEAGVPHAPESTVAPGA